MRVERWGSLSVRDHADTNALTVGVLLYDRLVVPVMVAQPDRDEQAYWSREGWEPELQERRLSLLGNLAIRRAWDSQRRAMFQHRRAALLAAQKDAERMLDPFAITRALLAEELPVERLDDVDSVQVIAAYSSGQDLRRDFHLRKAADNHSAQATILMRRLAVPARRDPEDSLRIAIALSRDPDFQKKRSELFDWQAMMADQSPQHIVDRIAELSNDYNEQVRKAAGTVRLRFAFTIAGVAVGFATGGVAAATATAALSLAQFAMLDRTPAIDAGSARPVAMFHDIREQVGLRLR